jgi:DNA-directed RNA polymerase subunit RPC12/RpoP
MSTYIPYCYLLGWPSKNKWYYGVEYANNKTRTANPSNLWVTYFTSSRHVKRFVEENGKPEIVQIRKTFTDRESAQLWESKVLRRLKVRENEKWLNVNPGSDGFAVPTGENHPCFGKFRTEESKQKQSKTRKDRHKQGLYQFYNHTPEQIETIRSIGKSNYKPKETRTYVCEKCLQRFKKDEYIHHAKKEHYRCKHCKVGRTPKPVIIFGVKYPSEKDAAEALKMSLDKIRHRISSDKYPDFIKPN